MSTSRTATVTVALMVRDTLNVSLDNKECDRLTKSVWKSQSK